MSTSLRLTAAILLTSVAVPALAQQAAPTPAPQEDAGGAPDAAEAGGGEGEEIVVTGALQRGSVPGDIAPEIQLNAADIRTYGAASVSELLAGLTPPTRRGRARGLEARLVRLKGRSG